MTYPLPKGKLQEFINAHEKLIVIEELEPILESAIKSIAYDIGYTGEIKGRTLFSRTGPITAEKIQQVIKEHYKMESEIKPSEKRTTLTHSECSNTTNFILSRIYELKKKSPTSFILGTDLGCEIFSTQTAKNPLEISLSVGATMGIVNGIVKLDNRVPVTICSHEMFLHSGVSALINAVYNENPQIAIIIEENSPEIQKNQQMYKLDYNNFRMSIGIPDQNYFQLSFEALEKNPKQFDDVFFEVLKLNNVRIIHIAHNPKGGH
jgi:indolepyruvate ferredoxin oxidoreductase alpha subunit